ncbi:MAG: hypothetical protein M3O23_13155 [Actinomycetota bacterium]|nr:hypothetical protein [Actinomycetota bacterium]
MCDPDRVDLDALIRQYVADLPELSEHPAPLREEMPVAVILADLLLRAGLDVPPEVADATM